MKVKVKSNLHYYKSKWADKPSYSLHDGDLSKASPDFVVIKAVELEFDIPDDFDPVPKQIESLKAKKQEVMADTQMKLNQLDEQIQRLLCIEHKEVTA